MKRQWRKRGMAAAIVCAALAGGVGTANDDASRGFAAEESVVETSEGTTRFANDATKTFALLVAVDNGREQNAELSALKTALTKLGTPEKNILILSTNSKKKPTRLNVEKAANAILTQADGEATLFVAFIGRAYQTLTRINKSAPRDYCFLTLDADVERLSETAFSLTNFETKLRASGAKLVVAFGTNDGETVSPLKSGTTFASVSARAFDDGGSDPWARFFAEALVEAATAEKGATFEEVCRQASAKATEFAEGERSPAPFWILEGGSATFGGPADAVGGNLNLVERDARTLARALANAGDVDAMRRAADMARRGLGGPVDLDEAKRFFAKAARLGDAEAYTALGDLIFEENSGALDEAKAFELYKKATELGDAAAWAKAGVCLLYGRGCKADRDAAFEYFKNGIASGDVATETLVGEIYWHGVKVDGKTIVARDAAKARRFFEKAAEAGDEAAKRWLAE